MHEQTTICVGGISKPKYNNLLNSNVMHANLENALKDDALNVIQTKIGPGVRFDSHRFIQVFTQCHQVEYIDALADCKDNGNPFGLINSEMAKYLRQIPSLQYLGVTDSANIFGSVNENAEWRL